MHEITASWETLMRQASMTSDTYFEHALSTLQSSGLKFTASDVIALAAISERDFNNSTQFIASEKFRDAIYAVSSGLENLVETISTIHEVD